MGFIHDLRKIATLVPKVRQSLFFSATMPNTIAELAAQFLDNPERVAVAPPSTTAERVEQGVIHVVQANKQDLLHDLLSDPKIRRALVFARTKHGADRVVKRLQEAEFSADAIHGNKSQGQRERALDAFKKGRVRVLVATEVAARGIDVDDISHVINYDLPNVPEQYVHRIGRTARAGLGGVAVSFCAPDERAYLRDIERLTKQPVPVLQHKLATRAPGADDRTPRPPQQNRGNQHADRKPHGAKPKQNAHGQSHARDNQARDRGDRRDRKGHDVWSNNGPPRNASAKRRPQRV
jgi:ATP-dependent RNA helicase RhlE